MGTLLDSLGSTSPLYKIRAHDTSGDDNEKLSKCVMSILQQNIQIVIAVVV